MNQMPELTQKKLEDRRRQFLSLIEHNRPQGSLRNRLTVVFDGKSEHFGSGSRADFAVVFTSGQSADDEIKRLVAKAERKKQVVVVTDDREIQYYVRALGASVQSVKEFSVRLTSDKSRAKPSAKGSTASAGRKRISKTLEHKINSEFEELWLKKGKKRET